MRPDCSRVPVVRIVGHCKCKYQAERAWGYDVQRWIGGKLSWKPVGIVSAPDEAVSMAAPFDYVLIRCRGCGSELVREMPNPLPDRQEESR